MVVKLSGERTPQDCRWVISDVLGHLLCSKTDEFFYSSFRINYTMQDLETSWPGSLRTFINLHVWCVTCKEVNGQQQGCIADA